MEVPNVLLPWAMTTFSCKLGIHHGLGIKSPGSIVPPGNGPKSWNGVPSGWHWGTKLTGSAWSPPQQQSEHLPMRRVSRESSSDYMEDCLGSACPHVGANTFLFCSSPSIPGKKSSTGRAHFTSELSVQTICVEAVPLSTVIQHKLFTTFKRYIFHLMPDYVQTRILQTIPQRFGVHTLVFLVYFAKGLRHLNQSFVS